ncbi:MAG: hypothetical protein JKY43_00890 [Phycisphaerales bacterium]|nr:hypothetical protein [Phycisphaerales bacterium]
MNPQKRQLIALTAATLAPLLLTACSTIGLTGGSSGSSITKDSQGLTFSTKYPTRAYQFTDKNTADIYLTDLSDDELAAFFTKSQDWSQISGTIAQIHLFLNPKPGSTPIEPTAASASIRWIVIANGQIGIYDGAGFLLPGRQVAKGHISGSIRNAPLRLTRKTPGFADPLITPEINIKFATKLDEQTAIELASRVQALAARATPIQ